MLRISNLCFSGFVKGLLHGGLYNLFRSLRVFQGVVFHWPWMPYTGELKAMVSLGPVEGLCLGSLLLKHKSPERSAGVRHQSCQSEEAAVLGHRLRSLPAMWSLALGTLIPTQRAWFSSLPAASVPGAAQVVGCETELVHSLNQKDHKEKAKRNLLILKWIFKKEIKY